MNHEDLVSFRENIANPRTKELFSKTEIPEGTCFVDKVELAFLDGRSVGVDSHFKATGLSFENGEVCVYHFEDTDLTASEFFEAHNDCIFVSDGSLIIRDDLEEMELSTVLRNLNSCAKLFFQMKNLPEVNVVTSPIAYFKMQHLMENGPEKEAIVHMDTEGLKVNGHVGTWHTIDHAEVDGVTCYLMEHDTYGDETACIIVDPSGRLLLEDVYDGLSEEVLDDVAHELLVNELFDDISRQIDKEMSVNAYGEPEAYVMLDNGRTISITYEQIGRPDWEWYYSGVLNCNSAEKEISDNRFPLGFVDSEHTEKADPDELRSLVSSLVRSNEYRPVLAINAKQSLASQIQSASQKVSTTSHTNSPVKGPQR